MVKLWLRFLKVWLLLNVTNGSLSEDTFLKSGPKFGQFSDNLKLIFTLLSFTPLVTFNGSHTFKKWSQNLATFLRILNFGQIFENRCKFWPQFWSLRYIKICVKLHKIIIKNERDRGGDIIYIILKGLSINNIFLKDLLKIY